MRLLFGHSEQVAAWVADHIPDVGQDGFSSPVAAIGVATDHLVAGVCYHDFQPKFGTIQLSMAATSPIWARGPIIHALLAYPFDQLGCFKLWTATALENVKALKVNEHVGFKREAILAHQFGHKRHAVIMRLLRPDYVRMFGEFNGQV